MQMKIEGNKLVITLDVSKEAFDAATPSASGKTKVIDSSRGFTGISTPNGIVKVSLNATV